MDALPEREVPDGPTVDVEIIRPRKVQLIPVRRTDPGHQGRAGWNREVTDRGVRRGHTVHGLYR